MTGVVAELPCFRYGRDGANYTSRATFDCYQNVEDPENVVIDYQPERCRILLLILLLLLLRLLLLRS